MRFQEHIPSERDTRQNRVDWPAARQALEDNPGKWGLVAENVASSVAEQLRKGRNKNFRNGLERFEFATRRPSGATYEPRRTNLWGRYTPDGWVYAEEGGNA